MSDVDRVGGKNASLGEMISQLRGSGIRVPGGFATTAFAFREFLRDNGLKERIDQALAALDVDDVATLARTGAAIRGWIAAAPLSAALEAQSLPPTASWRGPGQSASVAVRSSATAEDLPAPPLRASKTPFLISMAWTMYFMP